MADLDFSLLRGVPQPTPGQTVYQLPVHPQSGLDSFAGGLASGIQNGQQMALQRGQLALQQQLAPSQVSLANAQAQQAQMAVQAQQAQMQRQSALAGLANGQQPGQAPIAPQNGMGVQVPGQGTPMGLATGIKTQMGPQTGQMGQTSLPNQNSTPVQQGQPQDYNSAVVNYYKQIGRPDLAMTMLTSQQTLLDSTIKNQKALQDMTAQEAKTKFEHFEHAGVVAYGLTNVSDDQAVDLYNKQYGKIIRSIDPDAPKEGTDKDQILAYLHGASAAYIDVKQSIARNPQLAAKVLPTKEAQAQGEQLATGAKTPTETAKAQDLVQQRQSELDAATKSKGANSKEVQEAQARLTEAQDAVDKATSKGGLFEGITKPIGKAIGGLVGGIGNRFAPVQQQSKTFTYNPQTGKLE